MGKNQIKRQRRAAVATSTAATTPITSEKTTKKSSSYPLHTDTIRGHNYDDLIIVYSKYEEMVKDPSKRDPRAKGLYAPQWFATDLASKTTGIFIPAQTPILCTYEEMEELARKRMKSTVNCEFSTVKFYHRDTVMVVNGMDPF